MTFNGVRSNENDSQRVLPDRYPGAVAVRLPELAASQSFQIKSSGPLSQYISLFLILYIPLLSESCRLAGRSYRITGRRLMNGYPSGELT